MNNYKKYFKIRSKSIKVDKNTIWDGFGWSWGAGSAPRRFGSPRPEKVVLLLGAFWAKMDPKGWILGAILGPKSFKINAKIYEKIDAEKVEKMMPKWTQNDENMDNKWMQNLLHFLKR